MAEHNRLGSSHSADDATESQPLLAASPNRSATARLRQRQAVASSSSRHNNHGHAHGPVAADPAQPATKWYRNPTLRKIATIGAIMGVYSLAELVVALYYDSLVLLVDSLHNASDSLALAVAFWAESMKLREGTQALTFGWRRTELLGGLFNGFFLLSMSLFVLLEAIPKLIVVEQASDNGSIPFIVVASVGIFFNVVGSFLFSHGHSHGGSSHGHSHAGGFGGGGKGKSVAGDAHGDHGHSHSKGHGHDDHGHGHDDHGHGHDDHGHGHDDHGHGHGGEPGHAHNAVESGQAQPLLELHRGGFTSTRKGDTRLSPISVTNDDFMDNDHHDDDGDDDHGHGHGQGRDHNMWGLFIHFVGDVVTSLLVLGVGLIYHFYPVPEHPQHSMKHYWVNYADPVSSILSVIIILLSAWPLVKSCSWILLQTTALDLSKIREDIRNIDGVVSVHELHIWELVDSLVIASVHVVVRDDMQAHDLVQKVKKVLHKYGVHSTTIQPEFFSDTLAESKQLEAGDCVFPEGNCVQDCQEERCCPPKRRATLSAGDIVDIEVVTSTSHGSHSPIPTGIN